MAFVFSSFSHSRPLSCRKSRPQRQKHSNRQKKHLRDLTNTFPLFPYNSIIAKSGFSSMKSSDSFLFLGHPSNLEGISCEFSQKRFSNFTIFLLFSSQVFVIFAFDIRRVCVPHFHENTRRVFRLSGQFPFAFSPASISSRARASRWSGPSGTERCRGKRSARRPQRRPRSRPRRRGR